MNKKGFTLVELLLVLVIIGIIGAVTIPNIIESLDESKAKGGESVEQLLEKNLELYNIDNEEDLWDVENCVPQINRPEIEELYNMNPDIDMGQCLLQDGNSLIIERFCDVQNNNKISYKYSAEIVCNKDFDSEGKKVANPDERIKENHYYVTPDPS